MHYFYGISYQGIIILYTLKWGFPDSSVGKESAYNPGDTGSIPGLGRRPWRRDRLPPPYSWVSLVAQLVKNLLAMRETWV